MKKTNKQNGVKKVCPHCGKPEKLPKPPKIDYDTWDMYKVLDAINWLLANIKTK